MGGRGAKIKTEELRSESNVIQFPSVKEKEKGSNNDNGVDGWNYPGETDLVNRIIERADSTTGKAHDNAILAAIKEERKITDMINQIDSGTENGDRKVLVTQRRRLRQLIKAAEMR